MSAEPLRIAVVIYGDLEQQTGGYLYDRQLVAELRKLGCEVDVLSQTFRSYPRRLSQNLAGKLPAKLLLGRYDVVLEDEWNHASLLGTNAVLKGAGVPIVPIVHNLSSDVSGPLVRAVERRFLSAADGVIVNSQYTGQRVASLLGSAPPMVIGLPGRDHLPLGSDIDSRRSPGDPVRLLCVGNIGPLKGHDVLLRAAARLLHRPNWTLTIIGAHDRSVSTYDQLLSLRDELSLGGRVAFTGPRSPAEVGRALAEHDLFVLASPAEGFGIATLEAMGASLPVVASRGGATLELITDGIEGLLFEPGDDAALAHCIERLIDDPNRRHVMGQAGLKRYGQHPTWQSTCSKVYRFLQSRTST